jgi:DNA-binding SARP family transcriptional activator
MQFRLLGAIEVTLGGQELPVSSGKHRVLLAALLLHANRPVATQYLADRIWDADRPKNARATIQTYVRRLRTAIGDDSGTLIRTRPDGYSIEVEPHQLDLIRFTDLLDQAAAATEPDAERASLVAALRLWRGPALSGVPSERLRRDVVPHLTERWLQARERLTQLDLEDGRHAEVVSELQQLAGEQPIRERAWGQLMVALYRSGRRAEALDAYRMLAERLDDELGVRPTAGIRALHQQMLAGDSALDRPTRWPDGQPAPVPRQLPGDVPGFVGRGDQLRWLDSLLTSAPTQTAAIGLIAGAAGVGKTALAVHWGRRVADRFPDGQLFLDLHGFADAPTVEPAEALARLLRSLGVNARDVPAEAEEQAALYRSLLADRSVLVVLDNAASADQVRPLLPAVPGSCALVTSRNDLRGLAVSHGAHRLALDVLSDAESEALVGRLVGVRRAAAEATATAELVRLCGGLPLALRVAAANLVAAPRQSIAGHVARLRAGNILDELAVAGDPAAAVRAALDQSYAALPEPLQRMFRLLVLVPGPYVEPPAAAAVAGVPVDEAAALLDALASASLVDQPTEGQFTLWELHRRYAAELCDAAPVERDEARARLFERLLGPRGRTAGDGAPWGPSRAA